MRCVIVGGADIKNYELIISRLKDDDHFIYCDSGLLHMEKLKRKPDLIIGDFDSHPKPEPIAETIVLPCEKDDTDTFFAVKEAIKRGFSDFLLLGVVGGRLDHTLGNVSILLMLDTMGLSGVIIDDYSEMEIVSDKKAYVGKEYAYYSIINISGTSKGICETNSKYPLENAEITTDYQYGISNEPLPGETAEITVGEGRVLLIKIFKNGN